MVFPVKVLMRICILPCKWRTKWRVDSYVQWFNFKSDDLPSLDENLHTATQVKNQLESGLHCPTIRLWECICPPTVCPQDEVLSIGGVLWRQIQSQSVWVIACWQLVMLTHPSLTLLIILTSRVSCQSSLHKNLHCAVHNQKLSVMVKVGNYLNRH